MLKPYFEGPKLSSHTIRFGNATDTSVRVFLDVDSRFAQSYKTKLNCLLWPTEHDDEHKATHVSCQLDWQRKGSMCISTGWLQRSQLRVCDVVYVRGVAA